MAWWNRKPVEKRSYEAIIVGALEQAVQTRNGNNRSSALEAAAMFLQNELAGCVIDQPVGIDVRNTHIGWLARQALIEGEAVALVSLEGNRARLIPVADHHWQSGKNPNEEAWSCQITIYSPSNSITRLVTRNQLVRVVWVVNPYSPAYGRSASALAGSAASAISRFEQKMAEHGATPTAKFLTMAEGDNPDQDTAAMLRTSIANAEGKLLLVETNAGGKGSRADAPQRDYDPTQVRSEPAETLVTATSDSFERMIAATGLPPALFNAHSDGTSLRESLRQGRMRVVEPLRMQIQDELQRRVHPSITLTGDNYAIDLAGRAMAMAKLEAAGLSTEKALEIVGLLDNE